MRRFLAVSLSYVITLTMPFSGVPAEAQHAFGGARPTATPIQHIVVIFQENISFDHYFGTYPNAANPAGQPAFHATPETLR